MQEERRGQVCSGRIAAEDNLVFRNSNRVDEVVVTGERLDKLRRVLVLGCEAVVEEKHRGVQPVLLLELLDRLEEEHLGVCARVEDEASAMDKVDHDIVILAVALGRREPAAGGAVHLNPFDPAPELARRVNAVVRPLPVEHESDLSGCPFVVACVDLPDDCVRQRWPAEFFDDR